jgi:hypothetical protein
MTQTLYAHMNKRNKNKITSLGSTWLLGYMGVKLPLGPGAPSDMSPVAELFSSQISNFVLGLNHPKMTQLASYLPSGH